MCDFTFKNFAKGKKSEMWEETFLKGVPCNMVYNRGNWKQPKCPVTGDWLNKLWASAVIEYLVAFKIVFGDSFTL